MVSIWTRWWILYSIKSMKVLPRYSTMTLGILIAFFACWESPEGRLMLFYSPHCLAGNMGWLGWVDRNGRKELDTPSSFFSRLKVALKFLSFAPSLLCTHGHTHNVILALFPFSGRTNVFLSFSDPLQLFLIFCPEREKIYSFNVLCC